MKPTQSILIIGGGNMGGALARRWHEAGFAVHVVESNEQRRRELSADGLPCYAELAAAPTTEIAVLAIKPQQFKPENFVLADTFCISIMAGISLAQLSTITQSWVRIMPNLPSVIGEGMSVACAPALPPAERTLVDTLFSIIGHIEWVENEAAMHAVTAISGSGPAYVFALMEALEVAATKLGLTPELAHRLVAQTAKGAALLADQSTDDFATLRRNVTSPGGTTEAALKQLEKHGLMQMVEDAAEAATIRSKELSE